MPANERLAALMTQAGFVDSSGAIARKRFARAVSDTRAAGAAGRTYSHTYVSRWLNGTVPRDEDTRVAIGEAIGRPLGRTVSLDELGFRPTRTFTVETGLAYPDQPEDGVSAAAELFTADLDEVAILSQAPPHVGAWNDAAMAWLVGSQRDLSAIAGPETIGASDVVRLRAMRVTFDQLDSTFGGSHARNALIQYLKSTLPKLLRARGSTAVRRALFAASGELVQLAAWMTYDAGLHGLAQRYFIQALALADAGDDRMLAASILDAMSHQASFLGRFREAANMARAARLGAATVSSPILNAHFFAMEARALARMGDASACDQAMGSAIENFGRHVLGEGPDWIGYFDAAELAAELSHCHRDLGRPSSAIEHATEALASTSGNYVRSDFFVAMVLADAYVDQGEVEEGCRIATNAFRAGSELESARVHSYVDEFRARLVPHGRAGVVRDFVSSVHDSPLWTRPA